MRSFLFVPGDSQRKFESAKKTAADALILDLEDSIAPEEKVGARRTVREMLDARNPSQKAYVRVNALDTDMTLGDLAAVMPGRPDGIVLPKCAGAADVNRLSLYLDAFEAAAGIDHGSTRIVTVATETARAVVKLLDFENMSPRLWGMMWGAEDLAASLGASRNRTGNRFHRPFLLARDLCLISAAAAGVVAIDTIATDINDLDALRQESIAARQDGFLAKAVIHPRHVDVVNAAFMPTDEEIAWSEKVVKAFNDNPTSGVVNIDGKMIDKPHLRAAEKILALRGRRRNPVARMSEAISGSNARGAPDIAALIRATNSLTRLTLQLGRRQMLQSNKFKENTMVDALIIDACRTPRGIGKAGKGALSGIHPQQLGATVLRAMADRTGIDTADVDDIIWGTSSQRGPQSGDLGRMSALDAGYDVRASGVTLDRFCGSGITSVNMAANSIMSGSEDLVIAGGTEMMSMEGRRGEGPFMMDDGNFRLRARHPQSHQGVCADAVATLEGISRQDVDALGLESQKRAAAAIKGGHFDKSLVPVHREDGSLALDREEYPRPQATLVGLAGLKA